MSPDNRKAGPPEPGELVQRARLRASLTQEDLAERIGKNVKTVRNLEGGRHYSRATVEAVARELKTTPEALGFHFRKPLRPAELTDEQRSVIDAFLSMSADEQRRVRELLAEVRRRRAKR